jgi:hypothetical protein
MNVGLRSIVLAGCVASGGGAEATAQARPEVRVSGLFFGSFITDLGPGANSANRFDMGRAYINVRGQTSERVSFRITTDAIRENGQELEIRRKYAYVGYDLRSVPITIRFGQTHTPFLEVEEDLWEHRIQGSVPADRLKYMTTSDLGLSAEGAWGEGEQFQMTAGVYNGEGWARGEVDSGKDFMARATIRLASSNDPGALGGLRLTGYGQIGSPAGGGVRQRALGLLSYRARQFTVATEYLVARDRSDPAPGTAGPLVEGTLFNTFAVIKVPNTTAVFIGRLELYDPDRDTPDDRQTRITAGVGVRLAPELRVLGSLEHLTYQSGAPTPALDATRIRSLLTVALTF